MQIIQCLHAAILVSDLEKAENFYGKVLDLSKVDRTLKYPGVWYQIGEFQIHLIVHPGLKIETPNPEKWGRNPHIALAVINLDEAKQRLQAWGVPIQMSGSGRAALFVQDPDGNIIEIGEIIEATEGGK